jgi:hypothetical protein
MFRDFTFHRIVGNTVDHRARISVKFLFCRALVALCTRIGAGLSSTVTCCIASPQFCTGICLSHSMLGPERL